MKKQDDGQYAAQITADPGTHEYKFVVDGQWLVDPENMVRRLNRFGTENSVATIA